MNKRFKPYIIGAKHNQVIINYTTVNMKHDRMKLACKIVAQAFF